MPIRNLIHLQRDDVFHIQFSGKIDLLVEGREMFEADLGEMGGQAALNLRQRIRHEAD